MRFKHIFLFLLMMGFSTTIFATKYDAIVSSSAKAGEFLSINEALSTSYLRDQTKVFTIFIKQGIYNEQIKINRPNIELIGEDQNKTIIQFDQAAGYLDKQGKKIGTTGSAIFVVNHSDFTAENLTIRNSFDYPANKALPLDDPKRLVDTQAVTVLINNNSDRIRFRHVNLQGYQDTLFVKDNSRTYITDSTISGHVDFIFGGGTLVINNSNIIARNRFDIDGVYGYITAASTNVNQPYGLIIMNSHLTREDGVPKSSFGLGRPWHPTTTFDDGRYADPNAIGMTLFINNQIDDHIYGWDKMSGKDIKGDVIWFMPEDSRFFEFNNIGGSSANRDDHYQINSENAKQYTIENIFTNWPESLLAF